MARPAHLGPFTLGPSLGSGAFSTVRAAVHTPTQCRYGICCFLSRRGKDLDLNGSFSGRLAVKVIYSLFGTDGDDEITIMRDLRHPNILQFVQVGQLRLAVRHAYPIRRQSAQLTVCIYLWSWLHLVTCHQR